MFYLPAGAGCGIVMVQAGCFLPEAEKDGKARKDARADERPSLAELGRDREDAPEAPSPASDAKEEAADV